MELNNELLPFRSDMAPVIAGWATGATEVRQWCSQPVAPVPPEIIVGWSSEPDVEAFVLVVDDRPVAYGELWIDDAEDEVELAHLIVAADKRGQGIGRQLTTRLAAAAKQHHDTVTLRVLPENLGAIRCYLGAGFQRAEPSQQDEWNIGQPAPYVWMVG